MNCKREIRRIPKKINLYFLMKFFSILKLGIRRDIVKNNPIIILNFPNKRVESVFPLKNRRRKTRI